MLEICPSFEPSNVTLHMATLYFIEISPLYYESEMNYPDLIFVSILDNIFFFVYLFSNLDFKWVNMNYNTSSAPMLFI
jgi:hypothetical protein